MFLSPPCSGSVPGQVAAEAMNGDIIPVLNDEILEEYEDVLRRPKFGFDERAVKVFLDELKRRAVYVDAGLIEDLIPDPKDIVFYAVLMEKGKRIRTEASWIQTRVFFCFCYCRFCPINPLSKVRSFVAYISIMAVDKPPRVSS